MRNIHSILIPVDFSGNTSIALAKAMNIFPPGHALTIHLFHVQPPRVTGQIRAIINYIKGYSRQQVNADISASQRRLENLKHRIQQKQPSWKILTWVGFGETIQESITAKARQLDVDLIIIGKTSRHKLLPFRNKVTPGKLAFLSAKPVLTVKHGGVANPIKTVVIPLDGQFPKNKLAMLEAIAFHSAITVRLVTFEEKTGPSLADRQLIFDTFRTFKNRSRYHVTYESISGKNKPIALLNYCGQVDADILIVYPGSETQTGYWLRSQISDLIQTDSRIQLLSLLPA